MLSGIGQYFLKREVLTTKVKKIIERPVLEYATSDLTTLVQVPGVSYRHAIVDIESREIEIDGCPKDLRENDNIKIGRSVILGKLKTGYSLMS